MTHALNGLVSDGHGNHCVGLLWRRIDRSSAARTSAGYGNALSEGKSVGGGGGGGETDIITMEGH